MSFETLVVDARDGVATVRNPLDWTMINKLDAKEGIAAFFEKRPPRWAGR